MPDRLMHVDGTYNIDGRLRSGGAPVVIGTFSATRRDRALAPREFRCSQPVVAAKGNYA
jgi:hypothetical protein